MALRIVTRIGAQKIVVAFCCIDDEAQDRSEHGESGKVGNRRGTPYSETEIDRGRVLRGMRRKRSAIA